MKSLVPGTLPVSPLLTSGCQLNVFPWWKGNRHQEEVISFKTKSSGVLRANFSFEHEVLFGRFAHGSDMCLLWGIICVGEVFIWDSIGQW